MRGFKHRHPSGLVVVAAAVVLAACSRDPDRSVGATQTTGAVLLSAPPIAPAASDDPTRTPPPLAVEPAAPPEPTPEPTLDRGAGDVTWATRGPQGGTVTDVGAAYPLPSAASLKELQPAARVTNARAREPAPPSEPFFETSFGAPPPNDSESSFGPDAGF